MANPKIYDISRTPVFVSVVTPASSGQSAMVKTFKIASSIPPWLEVVVDGDGQRAPTYGVRGVHARAGYRLLEDFYADEENERLALLSKSDNAGLTEPERLAALAAAEKLQGAAGWAQYQKYLSDWQSGRTSSSFPAKLLPRKVAEMMSRAEKSAANDPWASDEKPADEKPATRRRGK